MASGHADRLTASPPNRLTDDGGDPPPRPRGRRPQRYGPRPGEPREPTDRETRNDRAQYDGAHDEHAHDDGEDDVDLPGPRPEAAQQIRAEQAAICDRD